MESWICGFLLTLLVSCSEQEQLYLQGSDCTQIKMMAANAVSGVYTIKPSGVRTPFKVSCEMRADGGWTVFQRRTGNQVSFQRNWAEYENGFGYKTGDHWLGLRNLYLMTRSQSKQWTLRVDLWDHEGGTAFAEYKGFRLGDARTSYQLNVKSYDGNAGDAIRDAGHDQNGKGFSTVDRDNDGCHPCLFGDIAQENCARSEGGGWWFSNCGSASLNGEYHSNGDHIGWASGLHWDTWKEFPPYSVKSTRMMIKSEKPVSWSWWRKEVGQASTGDPKSYNATTSG